MTPNTPERVRSDYDKIAADYAECLYRELEQKPFDREVLTQFARAVGSGEVCELGCGPGQVAAFLAKSGVRVSGIDLSPRMIAEAQQRNPEIAFRVGNMMALDLLSESLGGIVAFYAIVNLLSEQIETAFEEMARVLQPGGRLLLAFHVGDEVVAPGEMWGHAISMEFYFLDPERIQRQLKAAGFDVEEVFERGPYAPEVEHQSRRAYVFARKGERLIS